MKCEKCGLSPLITTAQAAQYLGLKTKNTLEHWRSARRGPAFVRVGAAIKYRIADLEQWLEANTERPAA